MLFTVRCFQRGSPTGMGWLLSCPEGRGRGRKLWHGAVARSFFLNQCWTLTRIVCTMACSSLGPWWWYELSPTWYYSSVLIEMWKWREANNVSANFLINLCIFMCPTVPGIEEQIPRALHGKLVLVLPMSMVTESFITDGKFQISCTRAQLLKGKILFLSFHFLALWPSLDDYRQHAVVMTTIWEPGGICATHVTVFSSSVMVI